jgi:hypothetical protein
MRYAYFNAKKHEGADNQWHFNKKLAFLTRDGKRPYDSTVPDSV